MAGLFKVIKSAVTGSEGAPFELVAKHQHFEERSYPAAKWVCTKRKGRSRQEVQKDMFMTLYGYISGKNEGNAKIEMTVPVTVTYVQCEEEPEPAAKENGESEQNGTAEAAEEPKKEEAAAEEKKEEPKENGDKEEEEKKEGDAAAADEKKEEGKKEGDAATTNGQDGGNKAGKEKKDKKAKSKEKPAGPLKEYTMGFYIPKAHQESPPKPSDPDVFIEERPAMTIVTRTFGGYAKESQWENERQGLAQEVENTPGDLTVDPASFFTAGYDPPFKPLFRRNEVWLLKTGGSVAPPPEPEKPAEKQEEAAKGKEENGKPKEEEKKKENGEEKKKEEEEEQAEGEGEKKKDEE